MGTSTFEIVVPHHEKITHIGVSQGLQKGSAIGNVETVDRHLTGEIGEISPIINTIKMIALWNSVKGYTISLWILKIRPSRQQGCFECGAMGHFKAECPSLKNTYSKSVTFKDSNDGGAA